MTANDTHTKIIGYLGEPLKNTDDIARVYVFSDPDRPEIIKIGSAQNPSERKDELVKKCRFPSLTMHFQSEIMSSAVASKVETLAHYELGFFRRRFNCGSCSINHREFFQVDWRIAESVVKRWTGFFKFEPYDENGGLKEGWKDKMTKYTVQNQPEQDHENHDDRGKWWGQLEKILVPQVIQDADVLESKPLLLSSSQIWAIWSVLQALVLVQTTSSWFVRYFIFMPNLIGIIVIWLLMDTSIFAFMRGSIVQILNPRLNDLRLYFNAKCKVM
jgi:hypothetical protein